MNRAFIKPDGQTIITCPSCARSKEVKLGRPTKRIMKVKCSCNHKFAIELEFRQYPRKMTNLKGVYRAKNRMEWNVNITNLSMGGARLHFNSPHNLAVGDEGTLEVQLDNRKQSLIKNFVVIRTTSNEFVGCQFTGGQEYNADLGFYLRP